MFSAVNFHCLYLLLPVNSVTFARRGTVQLITVSPVSTPNTLLSQGLGGEFQMCPGGALQGQGVLSHTHGLPVHFQKG